MARPQRPVEEGGRIPCQANSTHRCLQPRLKLRPASAGAIILVGGAAMLTLALSCPPAVGTANEDLSNFLVVGHAAFH